MRIKLDDKQWLNSDTYSCWITRETINKNGKKTVRNMSGYYPTFEGAVVSYIEKRIKSSEADKISKLKNELKELKAEVRGWKKEYEENNHSEGV